MQLKSFLAVAAVAVTVSAQGLTDVITNPDGTIHGDNIANGTVVLNGAMDFARISKPKGSSAPAQKRETVEKRQGDDEPFIPEWQPGQQFVEEVPESEDPPVAPSPKPTPTPKPSPAQQGHGQEPTPSSTPAQQQHEQAPADSSPAAKSTPAAAKPTPVVHSTPKAAVTTAAPLPSPNAPGTGGKGAITFNIVNKMGGSISISYQLGTYSPATGGPTTVASQLLGIGSATTGTFASSTQVIAPVGWAGRFTIGKGGGPLDFRGTKIEGNNGFDGADPHADPDPDIDVSYVDGYSVPASCSCASTKEVLTGCNKQLFDLGNKCTNLVGSAEYPICVNDPRNIHGPATPFFAPCNAAAYTYDYNDVANWQGTCEGNTFDCCIGTDCPAPKRQPAGNTKREVMALLSARKRAAAAQVQY